MTRPSKPSPGSSLSLIFSDLALRECRQRHGSRLHRQALERATALLALCDEVTSVTLSDQIELLVVEGHQTSALRAAMAADPVPWSEEQTVSDIYVHHVFHWPGDHAGMPRGPILRVAWIERAASTVPTAHLVDPDWSAA